MEVEVVVFTPQEVSFCDLAQNVENAISGHPKVWGVPHFAQIES